MEKIKIAIAEDQGLFRKAMIKLLHTYEDFDVVLEAEDGVEFLELLSEAEKSPNVALIDLSMPLMDGIEVTEQLKIHFQDLAVIILSMHNEVEVIENMFRKGVNAYLDKNTHPETVAAAIRQVNEQGFYFDQEFKKHLKEQADSWEGLQTLEQNKLDTLSRRETQILQMICLEYTNAEIAKALSVSKRTVETHRRHLLDKTSCRNSAGLVLYAVKNGIVDVTSLKVKG
jgi:DNA-binding NarL/FixJ family response regulator